MVFDFWKDPVSGDAETPCFLDFIPAARPLYVVVSHHHKDHFTPAIFKWSLRHPDVRYILSKETARFARHYITPGSLYRGMKAAPEKVTVMRPGDHYEDSLLCMDAFGSSDCGNSWLVTFDGVRAFHAGDLNAWLWKDESTVAEVDEAMQGFVKILDDVAAVADTIDYCMFPVDSRIGTDYYTGAQVIADRFFIRRFFPMHFCLGENDMEIQRRRADAFRFDLYANHDRGEYIALAAPYALYAQAGHTPVTR